MSHHPAVAAAAAVLSGVGFVDVVGVTAIAIYRTDSQDLPMTDLSLSVLVLVAFLVSLRG